MFPPELDEAFEPSEEALQAAILELRRVLRRDMLIGDIHPHALRGAIGSVWAIMVRIEAKRHGHKRKPSAVKDLTVTLRD